MELRTADACCRGGGTCSGACHDSIVDVVGTLGNCCSCQVLQQKQENINHTALRMTLWKFTLVSSCQV